MKKAEDDEPRVQGDPQLCYAFSLNFHSSLWGCPNMPSRSRRGPGDVCVLQMTKKWERV